MTEQHVPTERLAAYAAGDLDATAALEVEAHVLLCADCRSDVEGITRATAALASVGPVTMPAEVAARLDAALATADSATGPAGDVLPMNARRKRPSFAGIAAVAAGVALFGAISVPLLTGGDGTGEPASTLAESGAGTRDAAATSTKRLASGLNYSHATLVPTLTRALAAPAGVPEFATGQDSGAVAPGQPASGAPAPSGPVRTSAGGTNYSAPNSGKSVTLSSLQSDAGRLAACIDGLAAAQTRPEAKVPLLVDFATFEGKPAAVIVFPTELGGQLRPDRIDVWVVGPRCGVTQGDENVLDFARFDRPDGL